VAPSAQQPVRQTFQIINLGPAFSAFWAIAQGKRFSEQETIWERVIEKPNQDFYDSMVWMKKDLPNWKDRRTRHLKEYFKKYPKLAPAMKDLFAHFEETLNTQIDRFEKVFPGAKFTLPVYAAPVTTFNGRAGEVGNHPDQPVLAFGIDLTADLHSDPGVLYSHELFHIYHGTFLNLDKLPEQSKHLTLPLWMEGFASYVSLQMNPTAPLSSVFMSNQLPRVKQKDIRWLARRFLEDAGKKSFDSKSPEVYQKWFNLGSEIRLRKDLPDRCGYLLGFYVVAHLAAGNHSVDEMVHWNAKTAESQVVDALKEL
jgi:uncharacterized protein YjaZ